MKRFRIKTGLVFASWALLLIFGCHKKRPHIAPEDTPPTVIAEIPTEPTEHPVPQTETSQGSGQTENTPAPEKPASKPPRHPKPHAPAPKKPDEADKPASSEEAKNMPPKVVIQEGGAGSGTGHVSTGAVNDSATAQSTTQQLLESTENNLRNIKKRRLSSDEQSLVAQIEDYVKQSKDAGKVEDSVRAHNLALKARLLSDELVK
jgi:hypothetical protein